MTVKGLLTLATIAATVGATSCGVFAASDPKPVMALAVCTGGLMLAGCLVVAAIIKALEI